MIFADATPSFVQIGAACGALFFLAGLYNQVMKAVDRMKDKPAPSEVRAEVAAIYTRQRDFDEHVRANEKKFEQIETNREKDRTEAKQGRQVMYEKIDDVKSEIAESERRMIATQELRLDNVHTRVTEILGEVREIKGASKH
jgi:hypothetical protein